MSKRDQYLFDVQAPMPEINLTHLTASQRHIIDAATKVVVGVSVVWYSLNEIAQSFGIIPPKDPR